MTVTENNCATRGSIPSYYLKGGKIFWGQLKKHHLIQNYSGYVIFLIVHFLSTVEYLCWIIIYNEINQITFFAEKIILNFLG